MPACVMNGPPSDDADDTVRARIPSVAEITLEAVIDTLGRVQPSARAREFRGRAEVYRVAIAKRATVPPSVAQRVAMRELVSSLHEAVVGAVDSGVLAPRVSS
jgi:hypothetical protein